MKRRLKRGWVLCVLLAVMLSVPARAITEEEMETAARKAAQSAVVSCVTEDMTDVEKLTVLHDWMALHCDYGASPHGGSAYGALVEGVAVCTGYAQGYAYLAEAAGLRGAYTYSAEIDHAWILATLDGVRYFSDCTWDDGKHQKMGYIRHSYFLFNQNNASLTGHTGWDSTETVAGGRLEAVPWASAVTRVIFDGDYAYYFDTDFRLIRCDRSSWRTEVLLTVYDRWSGAGKTLGREELYTGLVLLRGRLYYNTTNRICWYDPETGETGTALTPALAEGRIFGLGVRDGRLCYSVAESQDDALYDVVDTGISARSAWGY